MRTTRNVQLLISLLCLLFACAPLGVRAEAQATLPLSPGWRLLESSPATIELELSLPPARLRQVAVEGRLYDLLEIEGLDLLSEEGKPRLPFAATLVAVPPEADVSLEVVDAAAEVLPGSYRIPPQATLEVEVPLVPRATPGEVKGPLPRSAGERIVQNQEIYGHDAWFPAQAVELSEPAFLRSQRVVGLRFYPLQVNPVTGEVRQARRVRIRLQLSYPGGGAPSRRLPGARAVVEPNPFESLLRSSLVNYDAATGWRAALEPAGQARSAEAGTPPTPGYRLVIGQDGLYELTYSYLSTANLPVDDLDPRTFQVFTGNEEVAIQVVGEEDGSFDPGDVVLFWAEGLEDKYAAENVYWLGYGVATGLRMATRPAGPGDGLPIPASTGATAHLEQDVAYWSKMPGDDDLERFYWTFASASATTPGTITQTVLLEAVASVAVTPTLDVALVGYTSSPLLAPDHHVQVYVNGHLVGDLLADGVSYYTATLDLPQDVLQPGDNEVRFYMPGDTGATNDLNLLDWFEVHYQREYRASADLLRFGGDNPGEWAYTITDFTTPDVELLDITEPTLPQVIEGAVITPTESGYSLSFGDSSAVPRQYWAQTVSRRLSPLSIEPDSPSDLRDPANGADYLVITHGDFSDALLPLLEARATQGYRVMSVDVQDVYDEFGGGRLSPAAIRSFLAFAYHNWVPPAPSYVLLVGDGHFDPKDHLGYGLDIYIPAYLGAVDPWIGETAADNWYACFEGSDKLPDVHIGRLPVNSAAETAAIVAKILAYESLEPAGWMANLLFVSDNPDSAGDFYASSDELIAGYLPPPYVPAKVYLGSTCASVDTCRPQVLAAINDGRLVVNYVGHGAVQSWAGEGLFRTVDVATLANGEKLPLFVPMTCLEGSFHYPYPGGTAVGEAVVITAGKGGVASWSPTGFGVTNGHDTLNQGLYEALFFHGLHELGPATYAAKLLLFATGKNLDQLDTYHILGDPALHLHALDLPHPHQLYLPLVLQGVALP